MALGPRPSIVGAGLSFGNQACEVTESLRHPHKVPVFTRHFVVPLHETGSHCLQSGHIQWGRAVPH